MYDPVFTHIELRVALRIANYGRSALLCYFKTNKHS